MSQHLSVPSYRKHRQSGQAIVTLVDGLGGRRDVLLGKYGTAASRAAYARTIAEWEARGRTLPAAPGKPRSVNEILLAFVPHARQHYRRPDGTPTGEYAEYQRSLKPVKELYGLTSVVDFGPLALKAVRLKMLEAGWCRGVINQRIGRVVRVFKWAAGEQLAPVTTWHALTTVRGLERGRTSARESKPVAPVAEAVVEATLPHVLPPVAAMARLQLLTGMRPGEVCGMRPCDLDTSGPIWLYRPAHHKTAHRGKRRVVALGPQAQAIVRQFLTLDTQAHLFSPRRALEERRAELRAVRKTRVQPSQVNRRTRRPRKAPGDNYTPSSYSHSIRKACERAGVPAWFPHQLRHTHATEVRRRFGLEAAQVALGHSQASVTEIYAERDATLAIKVAAEIG